jgi:hypothetical protein
MSYSITQFQNSTQDQLSALDNNFTTFGALVPIPCSVAGTNTLTLTQSPVNMVPTPTLAAYTTNVIFNGVAVATNGPGGVTAAVGGLPSLPVYKDTVAGPVALTGNEIVLNCAFSLRYDAALNSGNGGFHLASNTSDAGAPSIPSSVQINGGSTLTMALSGSISLTFTATPGWSSQDQLFSVTGALPTIPAVGDFMQVVQPSLGAAGVGYSGLVTAVGSLSSTTTAATIAIRLQNAASASLASNSGIYRWLATRSVP